jgi:hypothetical protein
VFAPDPAVAMDITGTEDPGWLLREVLEGRSETNFIVSLTPAARKTDRLPRSG